MSAIDEGADRVTMPISPKAIERVASITLPERPEDIELWSAIDVWEYWIEVWRQRIGDQFDVSIILTGASGVGKSSCAIQIGMDIDPGLTAATIGDHIAFTPDEFIDMLEKAKPEQVVIFDEGVRGLLSSDTMSPEQKSLTTALALVRAKRLVLIILAPDIWQLAKNLRSRRAEFWIHVQERGVAWVHAQRHVVHYKNDPTLGFSIDRTHGPLTWNNLDGTPLWDAYYSLKMTRMSAYLQEARDLLHRRRMKGTPVKPVTHKE